MKDCRVVNVLLNVDNIIGNTLSSSALYKEKIIENVQHNTAGGWDGLGKGGQKSGRNPRIAENLGFPTTFLRYPTIAYSHNKFEGM